MHLRNDGVHRDDRGMALRSKLQPLDQLPANRQQQRRIASQMCSPEFIKPREVFKHGLE